MKVTATTQLKNSTWVKITHNDIQLAIIWADNIKVEQASFGKHYTLSDGSNGIIGFAYSPAEIEVAEHCVIESAVNQEVKP